MVFGRPTGGSTTPNDPMVFDFKATLFLNSSKVAESKWSSIDGLDIVQDPIDVFRQEYLDFNASPLPSRFDAKPSLGSPWNSGNYSYQLDDNLQSKFSTILSNFSNAIVLGTNGQPVLFNGKQARINSGGVAVSNAYRCPRKNIAVGSGFPIGSKHVWGKALDIVPNANSGTTADGRTVQLDLHKHIYPTLLNAAKSVGTAICEAGPVQVPPGSPSEDHVHVQWG